MATQGRLWVPTPHNTFVKMQPDQDCHHTCHDAAYKIKDNKKENLVLTSWPPENVHLKTKMINAVIKENSGSLERWHSDLTAGTILAEDSSWFPALTSGAHNCLEFQVQGF